jgi:DNA modification methylase
MRNQIICGDAKAVLQTLPSKIISTTVTSPPYYGLRRYMPDCVKLKRDVPEWVKEELARLSITPIARNE